MTILVSLISDQTIPNVLFIKEQKNVEKYIFVTTNKMELNGKSQWVIDGSGMQDKNVIIMTVVEDSIEDIKKQLSELKFESKDKILVNLTGGTKIMSIGVYNFFKNMPNSEIIYIPVGKNAFKTLKPEDIKTEKNIDFRITLNDYLVSYGIELLNKPDAQNLLLQEYDYTKKILNYYLNNEHNFCQYANQLRPWRNRCKKPKKIADIENCECNINGSNIKVVGLQNFLNLINFPLQDHNNELITKKEIEYLTGGWFEELTYSIIKETLKLKEEFIGINIKIQRGQETNEFDVMYVNNNTLSVVECKTAISETSERKVSEFFNEIIHKLTAVRKDFGLVVNSYLFTLSNFNDKKFQVDYKERAETFNIKLIDKESVECKQILETKLK